MKITINIELVRKKDEKTQPRMEFSTAPSAPVMPSPTPTNVVQFPNYYCPGYW